jgi:hypothetical protein
MTVLLVDYSKARPTPAAIKAAGYAGVVRYLSLDADKNLSPAERDGLLTAGQSITLVWETEATRAGEGFAAGAMDCRAAEAQARALGYPASCPIFYAVDFGAAPALVLPYFTGVASAATFPVGIYGSARVVEGVSVAPWKWQAAAWSAGRVSPLAHLYQRVTPTVAHPITDTDENVICRAFPTWSAIAPPWPAPAPVPTPVPLGVLTVNTIDLRGANSRDVTGAGVAPMQRLLGGIAVDGQGGPVTHDRLGAVQMRIFHAADYEFGVLTADALLAGR